METIIVKPNLGINNVYLGMNRNEVHNVKGNEYYVHYNEYSLIEAYDDTLLSVHYNESERAFFIEQSNLYSDYYCVLFEDIDVFKTKAEDLIKYLEKFADYDKNDDARLGFQYIFKDLGISLWRPNVFREEILNESWFQNYSEEQKQDELNYQYFQTVAVWTEEYYNNIKDVL